MIQGHNEQPCYVLHPELYSKKERGEKINTQQRQEEMDKTTENNKQQ